MGIYAPTLRLMNHHHHHHHEKKPKRSLESTHGLRAPALRQMTSSPYNHQKKGERSPHPLSPQTLHPHAWISSKGSAPEARIDASFRTERNPAAAATMPPCSTRACPRSNGWGSFARWWIRWKRSFLSTHSLSLSLDCCFSTVQKEKERRKEKKEKKERKKERQRDRERERETERQRNRETERQRRLSKFILPPHQPS